MKQRGEEDRGREEKRASLHNLFDEAEENSRGIDLGDHDSEDDEEGADQDGGISLSLPFHFSFFS